MSIYEYNGKKNICGPRIKEARKMRKITQTELAAKMQIHGIILDQFSISRIEAGTRFITDFELWMFSKILNVDMEWLLLGDSK
jgi:transcriptional regulator with XRE-family HTH domain